MGGGEAAPEMEAAGEAAAGVAAVEVEVGGTSAEAAEG